jgi:protein SCO1
MIVAVFVILLLVLMPAANAQGLPASQQPPNLRDIGIDQKLDSQVPLELEFVNEAGATVRLKDLVGQKPVVLSLVYYECPMLCTLVLNGMLTSFRTLAFTAGKEFDVITVSISPDETPELASAKKKHYLDRYNRAPAEQGWHFLTGREDQIKQLAHAVGFRYQYDPVSEEYAHASGIMVLTPQGRLARYFYGIEYAPRDLRLGLVEASENRIGSPVDQILLYCLHYDPMTGKYGVVVKQVLRLAGLATILILGGFIGVMLARDRANKRIEEKLETISG